MVWACARIDEERMVSRVLMVDVSGGRLRGKPRLGWMDSVNVILQQWNDGGGCTTMRERSERVEDHAWYICN